MPAEPDLALLRHQPLDEHLEAVAGADVPGEVHRPGVDVGEVPRQPLPLAPPEELVVHAGVERHVQRVVDRAPDLDDLGIPQIGWTSVVHPLSARRNWSRCSSPVRTEKAERERSRAADAGS